MKATISALVLINTIFVLSAAGQVATVDPKLAVLYAKDRVVEVEIFTSHWDNLKGQVPRGGLCAFGFIGEQYDWFRFEIVRINGVTFRDAGVKKRAWCGSESQTKPSLHIKLDKFDKAQDKVAQEAIGASALLLNNSIQDAAYVRQCLAYEMWTKAGVASPLCNFAHVRVNDEDMGVYVNVQPMKKPFLQSHYGVELGNVYEFAGEDFEAWARDRLKASLDSMKKEEDKSLKDIDGIMDAVSDDSGSMEKIERLVDLDEFFRFWAMEIILTHFDGFDLSNNNAYVYFPVNGKMQVLPWGPDTVLTRTNDREARQIYNENRLTMRLWENPAMRQRLLNTINEQVRSFWNENALQAEVDRSASTIERLISVGERSGFHGELATLKRNIRLRREQIASFSSGGSDEMFDVRLQNMQGKQFCMHAQSSDASTLADTCGNEQDQRWDVARGRGEYVRLRNAASNTCVNLEVDAEHTPTRTRTCNQQPDQSWKLIFNRGAYLFESEKTPGTCLSLSPDANETVVTRKCDRSDASQNWRRF